jgi:hypothetical protein
VTVGVRIKYKGKDKITYRIAHFHFLAMIT